MRALRDLLSGRRAITGRDVWLGIIGFFAIVFVANGIMVWAALETFSGIETEDAYRKGRNYNDALDQARRQQALGWSIVIDRNSSESAGNQKLAITVLGENGKPLNGLAVVGTFWSPTHSDGDRSARLFQSGNGKYRAEFKLPRPGLWQLRIDAEDGKGQSFTIRRRVFVEP